jgi:hypothetical protein
MKTTRLKRTTTWEEEIVCFALLAAYLGPDRSPTADCWTCGTLYVLWAFYERYTQKSGLEALECIFWAIYCYFWAPALDCGNRTLLVLLRLLVACWSLLDLRRFMRYIHIPDLTNEVFE